MLASKNAVSHAFMTEAPFSKGLTMFETLSEAKCLATLDASFRRTLPTANWRIPPFFSPHGGYIGWAK